jgi:hypothetical protein
MHEKNTTQNLAVYTATPAGVANAGCVPVLLVGDESG